MSQLNKPCQCGYDYEFLKDWTKVATEQVKSMKELEFLGEERHREALGKRKEMFLDSTERVKHYQGLVQKSCKIDMGAAIKNVEKAEKDVEANDFRQADLELSEAELKVVVKLQQCAVS